MKRFYTLAMSIFCSFSLSLSAQNTGDFRSVANGDWATIATWETYNGTTWVTATALPNVSITTTVYHHLTSAAALSIGSTTIENGASLQSKNNTLNLSGELTIVKGGNLVIDSGVVASMFFNIRNSGIIDNAGTFYVFDGSIRTNTDADAGTFNNKTLGVVNTSIYRDMTVTGQIFNNEGLFEKNTGLNVFLEATPFAPTAAFNNLPTGKVTVNGGSLFVNENGNWGGKVENSNVLGILIPSLSFTGSEFRNNGFVKGGDLKMEGTTSQAITGAAGSHIDRLTINNASGVFMTTAEPIVDIALTLQKGNINVGGNTLTLGLSKTQLGTLVGGADTSYVIGKLKRWVADTPSTVLYPIGIVGSYLPAEFTLKTLTSGGSLSLDYQITPPSQYGMPLNDAGFSVINVCAECGVWRATAGDGLALTTHDLKLTAANYPGIVDPATLRIVERDLPNQTWRLLGTHKVGGGTAPKYFAQRSDQTALGEFGIAGGADNALLPIELIRFLATKKGNNVAVQWAAIELNVRHYQIERSTANEDFETIGTVKAFGTSPATIDYTFEDKNPVSGVNYYRLRATDFDGKEQVSQTISVIFSEKTTISLFPNPTTERFYIQLSDVKNIDNVKIELLNVLGETLHMVLPNNSDRVEVSLQNLPFGTYFARISNGEEVNTLKVVKR